MLVVVALVFGVPVIVAQAVDVIAVLDGFVVTVLAVDVGMIGRIVLMVL